MGGDMIGWIIIEFNVNYLFNVRRELSTAGAFFESYAFLYSSIMLFVVLRRMRSRWICDILWMSGVDASELMDALYGDEGVVASKNIPAFVVRASESEMRVRAGRDENKNKSNTINIALNECLHVCMTNVNINYRCSLCWSALISHHTTSCSLIRAGCRIPTEIGFVWHWH